MEEMNINVVAESDTVTILQGHAPEQRSIKPNNLNIEGTLSAPGLFWKGRKGIPCDVKIDEKYYDIDDCYVEYSKENKHITLYLNATNPYFDKVKGSLKSNPDLDAFGINNSKIYGPQEMASFLKLRRMFFRNFEENAKLVSGLNSIKATIKTQVEMSKSDRGNQKGMIDKKVDDSNIPKSFTLSMPIFKGFPKTDFHVDICLDATDGGVNVWLESPELAELIHTQKEDLFEKELKNFNDLVCIEV